jgi:phage shock protein A
MFGWLRRLFGIARAEVHSALDKMEDPVKMSEQAVRELKDDLSKSLQGLAEVKALYINNKKQLEENKRTSASYEEKAVLLLQKAQAGEIDQAEADRLAAQALAKKEEFDARINVAQQHDEQYGKMVTEMEKKVNILKTEVGKWENELKTLKAQAKVSATSVKVNKQLAQADNNSVIARLEKMKEKVQNQEALAAAYSDMADANKSVDDEINKALGSSGGSGSEALAKLKAKMSNPQLNTAQNQQSSPGSEAPKEINSSEDLSDLDKLKQKLKGDS